MFTTGTSVKGKWNFKWYKGSIGEYFPSNQEYDVIFEDNSVARIAAKYVKKNKQAIKKMKTSKKTNTAIPTPFTTAIAAANTINSNIEFSTKLDANIKPTLKMSSDDIFSPSLLPTDIVTVHSLSLPSSSSSSSSSSTTTSSTSTSSFFPFTSALSSSPTLANLKRKRFECVAQENNSHADILWCKSADNYDFNRPSKRPRYQSFKNKNTIDAVLIGKFNAADVNNTSSSSSSSLIKKNTRASHT